MAPPSHPVSGTPGPTRTPRISLSRLPMVSGFFVGREVERARLQEAWSSRNTHLLTIVGWGGTGKTALACQWLQELRDQGWLGADAVFGWSFAHESTGPHGAVDCFMAEALRFFGVPEAAPLPPWEQGLALARRLQQQRVLLILDGLEPHQGPPGPREGELLPPALQSLLRELAQLNPGLCLLTTRLPVEDLPAGPGAAVGQLDLSQLNGGEGFSLLTRLGVKGTAAELAAATEAFGGHALALTLLGTYLADACAGDVRCHKEIGPLAAYEGREGAQARRVMDSYERWFGPGPELAVLRLLSLFPGSADRASLQALRAPPLLAGLTDELSPLTETQWNVVVARLRRAWLIAPAQERWTDTLSTHALIRDHFGLQLQSRSHQAWCSGHSRLMDQLSVVSRSFPCSAQEMKPLFAAIHHGCQAGRLEETLQELYRRRVQRGFQAYNTTRLGLLQQELSALSGFFAVPWTIPKPALSRTDQAYVQHEAAFALRALGRTSEALEPLEQAYGFHLERQDGENAVRAGGNLCELYLATGRLGEALSCAEAVLEMAQNQCSPALAISKRALLGHVWHQLGEEERAGREFVRAERDQSRFQPQYPLLYSHAGFLYCTWLLEQRKGVQARARRTLAWARQMGTLLDVALDQLTLVRWALGRRGGNGLEEKVMTELIHSLTAAGDQELLHWGELAQVQWLRSRGEWQQAQGLIDTLLFRSERSGLALLEVECFLESCRLARDSGRKESADLWLEQAEERAAQVGFHRGLKQCAALRRPAP